MSLAHMVYSTCTSVQNVKIIVTEFMEIIINKNRLLANTIYRNIFTIETVGGLEGVGLIFLIWYAERNRQFLIFINEIK